MSDPTTISRRNFIRGAAAAGVTAPFIVPASAIGGEDKPAASDRVGIGIIGCGGMGRANLSAAAKHPSAVVTAVCDVWKERRDSAQRAHEDTATAYHDHRELLAAKDVDAVIIATPPHWHTIHAVEACEAKKDIYLQKPMTLHLAESIVIRNAVKRHGRISQVGTQIHAEENYRRVVELIRSGNLGKVSVARTFNVMNEGAKGIGHDPNTTPPEGLDWERWNGPAPKRPFNAICVRDAFTHSFWWDFSGGWTPGMAPHIIDLPVWALDLGLPHYVYCSGGRYILQDDGDIPDVQEAVFQYPNFTMTWMMNVVNSYGFDFHGDPVPQRRLGIYFQGVNGTLFANYGMHKIVPEGDRMKGMETPKPSIPPSPGHEMEWIDSVISRKEASCSVDYHHRVNVPIVLANLSVKLGRGFRFDPATERIVGDDEAQRLSRPVYRDPWKFPEQYL